MTDCIASEIWSEIVKITLASATWNKAPEQTPATETIPAATPPETDRAN